MTSLEQKGMVQATVEYIRDSHTNGFIKPMPRMDEIASSIGIPEASMRRAFRKLERAGIVKRIFYIDERNKTKRFLQVDVERLETFASEPLGGMAWKDRKREVIERDKICSYCGNPAETVDHIVPAHQGGTNSLGNLVASCYACNNAKGHLTADEFRNGKIVLRRKSRVDAFVEATQR